ncbi:MAG: hypothetical protein NDP13_02410 [Crenarchaeota archaeon]|nr:hypothetical protein [Thermoproteota archaeon]MCR8455625.1 hypothetical protein [Thermoproteota archaeon]MCR8487509.1 hypothetical protein [Thermoproteota archaeon]MCR8501329.1 hypothetical protein [Thermoproteota archaeon]
MSRIKTPSLSLKELLVQIKDLVEIQLDLAYSAVIYDDKEAAQKALELESKIAEYLGYVIMRAVMAGRGMNLAEKMYALILFASALEDISEAAADISKLAIEGVPLGSAFKEALLRADEVTIRIKVLNKEAFKMRIDQIEQQTGMRVVAVKRAKHWILNPQSNFEIWCDDVLYLTGPDERVGDAYRVLVGSEPGKTQAPVSISEHLKSLLDILISLKYMAETSLILSYFALLTKDEDIVKEVKRLEEWVDYMREVLYLYTLRISRHFDDIENLRGIFTIIDATERITDSASKLTRIVEKGIDVSSFFKIIFSAADEKISLFHVEEGSKLAGKTLGELNVEENFGVFLLGIRRDIVWYFNPKDDMQLKVGDMLILRGSAASIEKFIETYRKD